MHSLSISPFRLARFICRALGLSALLLGAAVAQTQRGPLPEFVRPVPLAPSGGFGGSIPKSGPTGAGTAAIPPASSAAPALDLYTTDFESFPLGGNQLGGRDGWLVSTTTSAVTGILDFSPNSARAAYIGFAATTANSVFAWRPVNYSPVAAGTPVMKFSVDLLISDSTNGQRDDFFFMIYNTAGQVLGGIDFYNVNQGVFRYDGSAFQSLGTFTRGARDTLVATIDFAANRWSATLNGGTVFTDQPLTATSNALTLGDIAAVWFVRTAGSPGNNFMVFDNYRISTVATDVAPAITAHPQNVSVNAGQAADFTVVASGTPAPVFQWQMSADGGSTWSNVANGANYGGATAATLTAVNVTLAQSGQRYRCIASNGIGTAATSSAAILTVIPLPPQAPLITVQPLAQAATAGQNISFVVAASGSPAPTFQWQVSEDGGTTWAALADGSTYSGATTAVLTVSDVAMRLNGFRFRCVASNGVGSPATSATATLTVSSEAGIGVLSVAAGGGHTLFLRGDGSLWGMGRNSSGELGNGTGADVIVPIPVATGVLTMAAGGAHSLFVKTDGTLWGMGNANTGALGDSSATVIVTPVQLATEVVAAAGGNAHTLFIKRDGTLWAMGNSSSGQLGDGGQSGVVRIPVQVASQVVAVSAGEAHSMFVKSDGTLWATGANSSGQLGNGSLVDRLVPVQVASGVADVSAGSYHTLFLKTNGSMWGMGYNYAGMLGDLTTADQPTPVQIFFGVTAIAAGYVHNLHIRTGDELWGVGINNNGQLGIGTKAFSEPVMKRIATGVATADAAVYSSWFVKRDGSLWAMGENASGRLGDGTRADRATPVKITAGSVIAPLAPALIAATDGAFEAEVRLTWTPVLGATRYEVWRSLADAPTSAVVLASNVSVPFYDDFSAADGTTYYYWIKAGNLAGTSAHSVSDAGYRARLEAPTISTQPQSLTVTAGESAVFSLVVTASPAASFQWQRQPRGTTGFSNLSNTGAYSGVTSAALTLALATVAMGGDQFRCVVSNGVGAPVTSSTVTLGVNESPAITSAAAAKFIVGRPGSFSMVSTGAPAASFGVSAGSLPGWATFDATTGVISGTPPDATGSPFSFTLTATNGIGAPATQTFTLTVQLGHSADVAPADGKLNLVELTRVLELYNTSTGTVRTGRYTVSAGSVDGYAPDPSVTAGPIPTAPHTADLNRDGRLSLAELTRVIELYNARSGTTRTGAYHAATTPTSTEDGFAPEP